MRFDRRLLGWGVFFIVLGAVPLAVRAGLVGSDAIGATWRLWPLVLVGIGLGILLRGRREAVVGGILVAATVGLIGGAIIAGGDIDLGALACSPNAGTSPRITQNGAFGPDASVEITVSCGDLAVTTADGTGWSIDASTEGGSGPEITSRPDSLTIRSTHRGFPMFGPRDDWRVTLPRGSTIGLSTTLSAGSAQLDLQGGRFGGLSFTVNAGDFRVDLDGASASTLDMTVNAGSGRITLPAGSLGGSLTVNAGSIRVCAPPGVALRIATNDNFTASYDFGSSGLIRSGSTWASPGFDTAATRIDLSVSANAGSFALDPADGCR